MARHENAIHYQAFALQPLIMIAEFAERQNVDLYAYTDHGRTIRNAVTFLGQAIADPGVVKQYTNDEQKTNFSAGDIAELEFYLARFGLDEHAILAPRSPAPSRDGNTRRRQHHRACRQIIVDAIAAAKIAAAQRTTSFLCAACCARIAIAGWLAQPRSVGVPGKRYLLAGVTQHRALAILLLISYRCLVAAGALGAAALRSMCSL